MGRCCFLSLMVRKGFFLLSANQWLHTPDKTLKVHVLEDCQLLRSSSISNLVIFEVLYWVYWLLRYCSLSLVCVFFLTLRQCLWALGTTTCKCVCHCYQASSLWHGKNGKACVHHCSTVSGELIGGPLVSLTAEFLFLSIYVSSVVEAPPSQSMLAFL